MSDTTPTFDDANGPDTSVSSTPTINWSMYVFIGVTFIFFYLKYYNNVTLFSIMKNEGVSSWESFTHSLSYFLIYFVIVFIIQITESTVSLNTKCSDNEMSNFTSSVLYCFGPWVFIFLVMVIIINQFPLVKKAFSDVIGYAFVSRNMTKIFSELLYSSADVKEKITSSGNKEKLELAGEAIMKIVQDKSVFVNQIEPQNFLKNWNVLEPLMKDGIDKEKMKEDLFKQVLRRDIIGEFCWYLYTGLLVCSVVAYNVAVKSCKKSTAQLQKDFSTEIPEPNSGGPNVLNTTYS
jgi:hypothetical protein